MKHNNKLRNDEAGITHIILAAMLVLVVGVIAIVGWKVASDHKTNSVALITPTSAQSKAKPTISTPASTAKSATSASTSSTTTPVSTPAKTATTTPAKAATATTTPATTNTTTAAVTVVPQGYTNIGTIPASSLYNVKSPPAASEQPNLTIYACIRNTGSNTDYVQAVGVLSYPIPSSASSAWYVDLDLSSSASADNVVGTKSTTYSYQNNTWQNNGGTSGTDNESSTITTATINPGVVTDYYVWASGSYGSSTWPGINNHPNVTQLASCD